MFPKEKAARRKELETKEAKIMQEIENCKNALRDKKRDLQEIEGRNPEESIMTHAQIHHDIEDIEQNLREKERELNEIGGLLFNLTCEIPDDEE